MGDRLWDAFRAYPRVVREAYQTDETVYQRNLQLLKVSSPFPATSQLVIFVLGNATCVLGTFLSKSIIYLMATNIGVIPTSKQIRFNKQCKGMLRRVGPDVFAESRHEQNITHFAFLCASLWIIQSAPDLCATVMNLYKYSKSQDKKTKLFWQVGDLLTAMFLFRLWCWKGAGLPAWDSSSWAFSQCSTFPAAFS